MIKAIRYFIIFILSYLIVGYVKSSVFSSIHWNERVTLLDKLIEYYIRNFNTNLIPALFMSIGLGVIINCVFSKRETDKGRQ